MPVVQPKNCTPHMHIVVYELLTNYHPQLYWPYKRIHQENCMSIGHDNNIQTIQSLTGFSRNTQSKSYMLKLTEFFLDFPNGALWDIH